MVDLLLSYGAEIEALDAKARTPLHLVARWGKKRTVRAILAPATESDCARERDSSPAQELSLDQSALPLYLLLLTHGADPKARDQDGKTPLGLARHRSASDDEGSSEPTNGDSYDLESDHEDAHEQSSVAARAND